MQRSLEKNANGWRHLFNKILDKYKKGIMLFVVNMVEA